MMCKIKDTFISSIFVQFRIVRVLVAWGIDQMIYNSRLTGIV